MSTAHNIRNLLDIQDPNITFEGNCITEKTYKGKTCKYVDGKLTYTPTHCRHCGIKDRTQISRITLPFTGVHSTYLRLKKHTKASHKTLKCAGKCNNCNQS